jgi:Polyketide cyclase / dehydrase and lipid transport
MNHHTVTTTFEAPPEEVFAYLADIGRLPEWATEFARELKVVDGRHKVVNGLGEFFFELHADNDTGVIDMLAGPSEDALIRFPTRVVGTPAGGSAFTFTMFQAPGQSSEQFEGQYASLLREFENLGRRFNHGVDPRSERYLCSG